MLRPGGVLVTAEPAYQWLFGEADVLDHAEERFTAPQLARCLREARFTVLQQGYFNTLLAPAIVTVRLLRRIWLRLSPFAEQSTEFGHAPRALNDAFRRAFVSEKARVLRGGYPFGTSVICIARKERNASRAPEAR